MEGTITDEHGHCQLPSDAHCLQVRLWGNELWEMYKSDFFLTVSSESP